MVKVIHLTREKYMNKRKRKEHRPLDEHRGHKTITVSGSWGPHTAKIICADCSIKSNSETFVAWASTKRRRKNV